VNAFFENIANKEQGQYTYFDRSPQNRFEGYELSHYLTIPHKSHEIELVHSLSPDPCGVCIVSFELKNLKFDLEISTKSQFMALISFSKNRVKIKCNSVDIKAFIKSNKYFNDLKDIIKNTQFEPLIFTEINDNKLIVKAEYHLQLQNKIGFIKPMLFFYKSLIDEVLRLDKYKKY